MSSLEKLAPLDGRANSADFAAPAGRRDDLVTSSSFEETYPKHEFSELVRLGLALGDWLARRRRIVTVKPEVLPVAPPGPIAAAD